VTVRDAIAADRASMAETPATETPACPPERRSERICRRLFDILVAGLAVIVPSPLAALVAVLIRWRLGRPILFRQQRLGLHGEEFSILKFRTMRPAAYEGQPDSERLSKLGSALRATSIDELPQLVNVLRGQMSIIGPRPGLPEHLQRYCPRQRGRLAVRPGITGWAQVNGRNSLSIRDRIELDLWYIEHRCWRLDLRVLTATLAQLVRPRNVVGPGGVNPDFPPPAGSDGQKPGGL
jgi:lipopolysaccharide/colanic/teichoic acid biosynthesis glycosyltransferase